MSRLLLFLVLLPLAQGCRSKAPKTCQCPKPNDDNFKLEVDDHDMRNATDLSINGGNDGFQPLKLWYSTNLETGCSTLYVQCFDYQDNSLNPPGADVVREFTPERRGLRKKRQSEPEPEQGPTPPSHQIREKREREFSKAPAGEPGTPMFIYFIYTKELGNVTVHSFLDDSYGGDNKGFSYQALTCENSEWTYQFPANVRGGAKVTVTGAFCLKFLRQRADTVFGHEIPDPLPSPFVDV